MVVGDGGSGGGSGEGEGEGRENANSEPVWTVKFFERVIKKVHFSNVTHKENDKSIQS